MNGDSRSWYQPPEVMTDGHHKSDINLARALVLVLLDVLRVSIVCHVLKELIFLVFWVIIMNII